MYDSCTFISNSLWLTRMARAQALMEFINSVRFVFMAIVRIRRKPRFMILRISHIQPTHLRLTSKMHCISQSFKRISQFLNWNSLSNSYSFIYIIQIAWFSNSFPNSISEKSILSKISKSFSGLDFLRILNFQMRFKSISQVQIKIFQCFKILKFQNPKFSKIDFLRFPIFLRTQFPENPFFISKVLFQWISYIFSEFSNPFSQKSNSKFQNRFFKVQVFLRIHFPIHFLISNEI